MTEASYHLRSKATHKMMQTNLNIWSQKTDEENLPRLFSTPVFTPSTLGGKAEDENSTGQKSLLASWELFPWFSSCLWDYAEHNFWAGTSFLPETECCCWATSPVKKSKKTEQWLRTICNQQKYKGIGFCNRETGIQLKINQELIGKSTASLLCFCQR